MRHDYEKTWGGRAQAALWSGPEPDVTVRAKELMDAEQLEHRARYGTAPVKREWEWEAGITAALAERGQRVWTGTSAEFAALLRLVDPLNPITVIPDVPSVRSGVLAGKRAP